MDEVILQLQKVIAEALVTNDPHTVMMVIITHFAELGLSPELIVDQLKILGYITL